MDPMDEADFLEMEMEARLAEEEEIMRELENQDNTQHDEIEHWKRLL